MKFKGIKPGMSIRCETPEDAMALLEYLDSEGYKWVGDKKLTDTTYYSQYSGVCYHLGSDKYVTWNYGKYDDGITDFSDLVDYGPSIEGSLDSPEIHTGELVIDEPKEVHIEGIIQEFYFSDSAKEPIGGEWVVSYDATDFQDEKHLWWKQRVHLTDGCEIETEPYYRGKCEDLREEVIPTDAPTDTPTVGENAPTDSLMTTVEVLEWLKKNNTDSQVMSQVFGKNQFGYTHTIYTIFDEYEPQEIIQKITAYEAEKKKPIPVPVVTKWVQLCRIIQIQEDGTKKVVYEEELGYDPILAPKGQTAEILKCYISKHHEGRYIAVIEDICRERLEGEA